MIRSKCEDAGAAQQCPVCAGNLQPSFVKDGAPHLRCRGCGVLQLQREYVPDSQATYAGEDAVFFREGNERYYLDESNVLSCRKRLEWIRRHCPSGGRLLDAGAGFGHFLSVAREQFDCRGFDVSPAAVEWSKRNFQVDNRVASVEALPADGGFDVVTCWDVLEHVPDPRSALHALHALVQPGGFLFLSTPDAGSLCARLMGRYWHYVNPSQHITLFSRPNLSTLLRESGFVPVEIVTLGHYYRVQYVFDRLLQIHRCGLPRVLLRGVQGCCSFGLETILYLNMGDVMAICAQRSP